MTGDLIARKHSIPLRFLTALILNVQLFIPPSVTFNRFFFLIPGNGFCCRDQDSGATTLIGSGDKGAGSAGGELAKQYDVIRFLIDRYLMHLMIY